MSAVPPRPRQPIPEFSKVEWGVPPAFGSIGAFLLVLYAYTSALEEVVDAAWERGLPFAEELDAQLAEARERQAEVEAEYAELEEGGDLEQPNYHEGVSVEEQLIFAYAQLLINDPRGPFGDRDCVLGNMRAVIEVGARHPILASDEEILDAARDVYEAEVARRARRTCHTVP